MTKVFLIHGLEGSPNGGWRPWLMRELEKQEIYACALAMPNPDDPKLAEWLEEIRRHVDRNLTDNIYLVGHSLGGTAIIRYLEQYESPNLKGVVIVSAPCHRNSNGKVDDFLKDEFNWQIIKNKVQKVTVIHGDDDPLVPLSDAQETTRELNGKLIVIPSGKHLNGSAGFDKLPEALFALINIIKL